MDLSIEMNENVDYFSGLPEELSEKLLTYLDFSSLLKMHEVSRLFQRLSTDLIIKHPDNSSNLILENFNCPDSCVLVLKNGGSLMSRISGFNNILRHLRLCHYKITSISINFYGASKFRQRAVLSHIFNYCRTNLGIFSMSYLTTRLDYPVVSFNRVILVNISHCYLRGTFTHISELFPNVRDLKLGPECRSKGKEFINFIRTYPHVQFMKVSLDLMSTHSFNILCALNSRVFFSHSD